MKFLKACHPVLNIFSNALSHRAINHRKICIYSCSQVRKNQDENQTGDQEQKVPIVDLLNDASRTKERGEEDEFGTTPYPPVQEKHEKKTNTYYQGEETNPRNNSVILFPGQGTQYIGMGSQLQHIPNVQKMYAAASEILGYDLLDLCTNGPMATLSMTKYQQPAIFVASLAAVEKLYMKNPEALEQCRVAAGFSLGEITALTFAKAISFEDALRLIQIRGEAMQRAGEMSRGGMSTVFIGANSRLKVALAAAKRFCQELDLPHADCIVANHLYPGCKVIAGNQEGLDYIKNNMNNFNIRKLKEISVDGAFHTQLMEPALEPFTKALEKIDIKSPEISVHANVDVKKHVVPESIKKKLIQQIHQPVLWEHTMNKIYTRAPNVEFPQTFECGPGKSLLSILRKVNLKAYKTSYSITA